MFDFYLYYDRKSGNINVNNPYLNSNYFNSDRHNISVINKSVFSLYSLSFKNEDNECLENDEYILAIKGSILKRYLNNTENDYYTDIINSIKSNSFYDKYKGNFVVILFDKNSNEMQIINDHFALFPLYYFINTDKVIVSSNLGLFCNDIKSLDYSSILESILFTYPISENSILKNVKYLNGGEIIYISAKNIEIKKNFHISKLLFNNYEEMFDFEHFNSLFNDSVKKRIKDKNSVISSLTGGFDGRSILSVLLKNNIKPKTYSFGKKGGENTEIPLLIKKKINIDYEPIYLEEEYESDYANCALKAVLYSDGHSIFERANYIYAFSKLTRYGNSVLTGLIGGEILAPVSLKTDYINDLYFYVIFGHKDLNANEYLSNNGLLKFLNCDLVNETKIEIKNNISERLLFLNEFSGHKDNYLIYLYDLITLGFRRFYGSEMHMERYYMENTNPMFDIDIIEYIFSTKRKQVYKNAYNENLFLKRNNRVLQSKLIMQNYAALGKINVDRNFTPAELISSYKKVFIPIKFKIRKRRIKKSMPEFTSNIWSNIFYEYVINNIKLKGYDLFNIPELCKFMTGYNIEDYNQSVNKLISKIVYLNKNI